jgi:hypothetical protein
MVAAAQNAIPQSNRAVLFSPIRRFPSLVRCEMQLIYLFMGIIILRYAANDKSSIAD